MGTLIIIYGVVVVFGGVSLFIFDILFHSVLSKKVCDLLLAEKYHELVHRMKGIIKKIGKHQPRGLSRESKLFMRVWKDFRLLDLKNADKRLRRLQLLYRIKFYGIISIMIICGIPFVLLIVLYPKIPKKL
jgi:hypothetical protein